MSTGNAPEDWGYIAEAASEYEDFGDLTVLGKQVQLRRGIESENDAFVGKVGEVTVNTSDWTLRVHDESTPGGHEVGGGGGGWSPTAPNKMLYSTDVGVTEEADVTEAGRALNGGADAAAQRATLGIFVPPGVWSGLILSNNTSDATNDLDVAAGFAGDSTRALYITLASALTKRLDAGWAAGTNQGMRYSGAVIANTTYHIYLVSKAAGADPDIYADPSADVATALAHLQLETGGSAYVYASMIGSILRRSGAIEPFVQDGDKFTLKTPAEDVSAVNNPGTSAVLRTLTVPSGLRVEANIVASINQDTINNSLFISDPSANDVTPTSRMTTAFAAGAAGGGNPVIGASTANFYTNTSAQVRSRVSSSNSATYVSIVTLGWRHPRGKN